MPTHLLDTSVYCQPLKVRPLPSVIHRWSTAGDVNLATSSIADAEVLFGLYLKGSAALTSAYDSFLKDRLTVLPVDRKVADAFAHLKARQQQLGQRRADLDLLIAATARAHVLIVATLNVQHFQNLEGVAVEDWSRP